jgi:hypothetical protein
MNMKRGLVFTLCALALAASTAQAANVGLSLNLRYADPADPSEGGRWFLMATTDSTIGLAGVSAYISGIDTTGIVLGNATAAGGYTLVGNTVTGSIANGGNPYNGVFEDGAVDPVNVVWGQDIAVGGAITPNVGRVGGPGAIAADPLKNPTWDNAALLASGTFSGATRPAFVDDVGPQNNDTGANTLASTTLGDEAILATVTKTVRGDSLASLALNTPATAGLRPGDASRDFAVNFADFLLLQANFNTTGKTWDQGDFNDSANGAVDFADFLLLQANFNTTSPAPTVSAIPEPASMALAGLSVIGVLVTARRRRS